VIEPAAPEKKKGVAPKMAAISHKAVKTKIGGKNHE
jgi:hypothetical protein